MTTNNEDKEKVKKRAYSPRGTRRNSATIRIDDDVREELKELAEKLGVPVVDAMRQAVELLKSETEKE